MLKIGDIVTRKKYGNDIAFKIIKIVDEIYYLVGVDLRLYADSTKDDLILTTISKKKENELLIREINTKDYFYIPGKILHLDSDIDYLKKCEEYYKEQKIKYNGYQYEEKDFKKNILNLIEKHKPDILVLTGHDAHFKKRKNNNIYKNSKYFIETVLEVRKKYKNHQDIIIIAGACQSDYTGLIKAGASYASSPNNINIHALDPAIIAAYIALTEQNEVINLEDMLSKTKYGHEGIGGLILNGTMLKGYPRKEEY